MIQSTEIRRQHNDRPGVKLLLGAAVGLGVVFSAGTALSFGRDVRSRVISALPEQSADPTEDVLACAGGAEYIAQLELVPDAVVRSNSSAERIEYHAELVLKDGASDAGVAWRVDILNDRQKIVLGNITSGTSRAKGSEVLATDTITGELADGFFEVRVTAVVASTEHPVDVFEARQYIRVSKGIWEELEDWEWHLYSEESLVAEPVGEHQ